MTTSRVRMVHEDPKQQKTFEAARRSLRFWSWLVVAVHTSSFVALLIITLLVASPLNVPLWIDFGGSITSLGSYPIAATLLPFPITTAIFHAAQALDVADYYRAAIVRGVTPHRWIEYSITNGLITWSIFVLAGAGNILLPVSGVLINVVMQYFGYLHECANTRGRRSLTLLLWGFVPYLPLWIVPLTYYFATAALVPLYYGVAIIGTFVLSLLFTAPLFWRYFTSKPELIANYQAERAFLLLSLTAKLYLDWAVTGGNLANQP